MRLGTLRSDLAFECLFGLYYLSPCTFRVNAVQSSSNSMTFPGISHRGINIYWTTRGIQIGLCVLPSEYCGTIYSQSCASQSHLYLTVLELFFTLTTAVAQHRQTSFPDFLLNFRNFSDFFPNQYQIPWLFQVSVQPNILMHSDHCDTERVLEPVFRCIFIS